MTLDDLAYDMARKLLANPDDQQIEVWTKDGDWGWWSDAQANNMARPSGAETLVQHRIMTNDQEPSVDPVRIDNYAAELRIWLTQHVDLPM